MNSPLEPRKPRPSTGDYPLTGDPRREGEGSRKGDSRTRGRVINFAVLNRREKLLLPRPWGEGVRGTRGGEGFLARARRQDFPLNSSKILAWPRPPRSWPFLKFCQYLCLLLAMVCLGDVALDYLRARITQSYQSWRLDRDLRLHRGRPLLPAPAATGRSPAPAVPSLPDGSLVGRVEIPRIGISVMVLEGDGDDILGKAAGHVPASALPGGPGNVAIAGHRDSFFRALRNIRKDDQITFTTVEGTYYYQVASLEKVDPQDLQVLQPTGHPTLTLITCYPFNYIGPAPRRFVVQASEIQPSQLSEQAPSLAEASPALDSHPAQHAGTSRHHKATRLTASRPSSAPPARPLEARQVSSLPPSPSAPALLVPHPAASTRVTEGSEPTPAVIQAEQDNPPGRAPSAAHKRLGKMRAWLGTVSRHFRKEDSD